MSTIDEPQTTVPILVDWWAVGPSNSNEVWAAACIANNQGSPSAVTEFTIKGVTPDGSFGASMLWQRYGAGGNITCTFITEAVVQIL